MIEELALGAHGLTLAAEDLPTMALSLEGAPMRLDPQGIQARAPADAPAYAALNAQLQRFAQALGSMLSGVPPRLGTAARSERLALLRLGWPIRRLGRRDMRELLRIGGMNVYDLLEEHFVSMRSRGRWDSTRCSARISGRARRARC